MNCTYYHTCKLIVILLSLVVTQSGQSTTETPLILTITIEFIMSIHQPSAGFLPGREASLSGRGSGPDGALPVLLLSSPALHLCGHEAPGGDRLHPGQQWLWQDASQLRLLRQTQGIDTMGTIGHYGHGHTADVVGLCFKTVHWVRM